MATEAITTEPITTEPGPTGQPTGPPTPGMPALSPSRAADFMTCPLLFRFRAIDRIPEQPSPAAVRGTLVHAILDRLFDLRPTERTISAAIASIRTEWDRLLSADPRLAELFPDPPGLEEWLTSCADLLAGYFALEDPTRLEPTERECLLEVDLDSGLRLRGFLDRVDEARDGALRIVDYKTGRTPAADYEGRALFQLKFYALLLWRQRGRVPRELRLLYLGQRELLRYEPAEAELLAFSRILEALGTAIRRAITTGEFRHRPSRLCDWCDHQVRCPAFGGTPPPLTAPGDSPPRPAS